MFHCYMNGASDPLTLWLPSTTHVTYSRIRLASAKNDWCK